FLEGKEPIEHWTEHDFHRSDAYGGFTKQRIFSKIWHQGLLKKYYQKSTYQIGDLSYDLYIHKSFPKNSKNKKLNRYQELLRINSLMEIDQKKEDAIDYLLRAGKLWDTGNKIEAYLLLHQAFYLFPEQDDIQKDWEIIRDSMSLIELALLEEFGVSTLQKVFFDLGFLPWDTKGLQSKELPEDLRSRKIKFTKRKELIVSLQRSNYSLEKYKFLIEKNRDRALWFLKNSLHLFSENKEARNYAKKEGQDEFLKSLSHLNLQTKEDLWFRNNNRSFQEALYLTEKLFENSKTGINYFGTKALQQKRDQYYLKRAFELEQSQEFLWALYYLQRAKLSGNSDSDLKTRIERLELILNLGFFKT
ncbi:hypothetical protein MJH12_11290, partial [bacterium]|nr:hypothetical protein [bacterium]